MTTRRRPATTTLRFIIVGFVVLACAVTALTIFVRSRSQTTPTTESIEEDIPSYQQAINSTQTRLRDNAALESYVATHQKKPSSAVRIAEPPTGVDWTHQDIIALTYSVYTARHVEGVVLVPVEGVPTVVIKIKEAAQGCVYTQVNVLNVLFVVAPKGENVYPVVTQSVPNVTTCELR
jgi:hypothetical protein